jgi:tryptophan synthase alpha chain
MMTTVQTQNRITDALAQRTRPVLNVYFTAGFPTLTDTLAVLRGLQYAGVDMVEIGMPYSDPVADGEVIQQSNLQALNNGMTLRVLFDQLAGCRTDQHGHPITVPILLMGYINPILQFGVEEFCQRCAEVGVDGVILPDLPLALFQQEYATVFRQYGLQNVFLITPQTTETRIRLIDDATEGGFIYMVSSASITGSTTGVTDTMTAYFERIRAMQLKNPRLIGFGIKDRPSFEQAVNYADGAIIGTAFIRHLQAHGPSPESIKTFVNALRD